MLTCSRRSHAMFTPALPLASERDECLLARLRQLGRRCDPVPEHALASARCALIVSKNQISGTEPLTLAMPVE
jgi:hypothetical protein